MKKSGVRTVKRRRRENRTDYLSRLKLLKSERPRIVFRKTNRYLLAQYVVSKEAQDKIEFGISSKILLKHGWPKEAEGSLKSIPAAYLTGFAMGKKIVENKLEPPIVDFGMLRTLNKTKLYGFLKGLIDSGIKIPCSEEAFPDEKRITGENLKNKIKFDEIKRSLLSVPETSGTRTSEKVPAKSKNEGVKL